MKVIIITFYLLFSSFCGYSCTLIKLNDGLNYIDLNNNGSIDIIFSANFDNNTSHPNRTATIFIRNNSRWSIVPAPDDSGFIWSDFNLSASVMKIANFELHKCNDKYYMISGVKISTGNNEDLTDSTNVRFTRYQLSKNELDPGVSDYFWLSTGSYITHDMYLNVDEAFKLLDMRLFK